MTRPVCNVLKVSCIALRMIAHLAECFVEVCLRVCSHTPTKQLADGVVITNCRVHRNTYIFFLKLFQVMLQVNFDQFFEEVRVLAEVACISMLKDVALDWHLA